MQKFRSSIFLLIGIFVLHCGGGTHENADEEFRATGPTRSPNITPQSDSSSFHPLTMNYQLDKPDQTLNLNKKLMEISGLSFHRETNQLLCINDEKANIFFLDPGNGEIEKEVDFGKNADYEGIEIVRNIVYVVKSNGNIYPYDLEAGKEAKVIKTPLAQENDIEGLGYDSKNNRLLLACKGSPNLEDHEKVKKTKAVYSYDLLEDRFIKKPTLLIRDKELSEWVKANFADTGLSKKKLEKLERRAREISPSAIAVHPRSGDYYLLSTVGKTMVIYGQNKELRQVIFLDEDVHTQPEGICFAPDGTLFISNEGRGLVARIHRFGPQ